MKIIFNRNKAIATAAPLMCATTGKSVLATGDGILIDAQMPDVCVFTTYDLEKGLRTTVEAKVIEEGSYIINAQKFIQTLKVMEGDEVTLTVDDKLSACFSCGTSTHRMSALKGSDFPQLPILKSELGFELPSPLLKKMIGKTMYAIGVNDQRPVLNGCFFRVTGESMLLVSCDSFRLAKCAIQTEMQNRNTDGSPIRYSFIIPVKTINELYKLLSDDEEDSIRIYMMRKHMVLMIGDITFFSSLIEGEYIDFDRIIIKNHKINIELDRDTLLSALERAALVTEEKVAGSTRTHVKLDIRGNTLKISANSSTGSTYDEMFIKHEGEDLLIAFNNRYLTDSIRAASTERIKISLSTPLSSINIEPVYEEGEETAEEDLFMLLPVKMKD